MQPAKEIDVWLVFRCSSSNYTRLQDRQKFSDLDSNSLSLCVGGGNWIFRVYRRDQMTKVQRQSSIYRTWNCYYLFIHARREMKDELILLQELSCRFPDSNMYFIIGRVMRQKAAIARQWQQHLCAGSHNIFFNQTSPPPVRVDIKTNWCSACSLISLGFFEFSGPHVHINFPPSPLLLPPFFLTQIGNRYEKHTFCTSCSREPRRRHTF